MAADHALLATFNKLGLNQLPLAKRRGRFRLIRYLRTFLVTWTRADLAGACLSRASLRERRGDARRRRRRAAPPNPRGVRATHPRRAARRCGRVVGAAHLSDPRWAVIAPQWLAVTTLSQVIQNSPAKPLWTRMYCNGPLWPETASEAACSRSKRWHPVDGCGPWQTGRISLRSRRPQIRILPGHPSRPDRRRVKQTRHRGRRALADIKRIVRWMPGW
jgi:hypothetical protein